MKSKEKRALEPKIVLYLVKVFPTVKDFKQNGRGCEFKEV